MRTTIILTLVLVRAGFLLPGRVDAQGFDAQVADTRALFSQVGAIKEIER